MQGEFNDLTTNNTATTFTNMTNNLSLSDELTASENYVRKMGTAYSAGKWAKRIVIATGITLTVSAAAILGGNMITNVYVGNAPAIASGYIFKMDKNSIYYEFAIESNPNNYPVTFRLYDDKTPIFTLDCSSPIGYTGYVDMVESLDKAIYEIYFTNRLDYKRTLLKGSISLTEE